MEGSSRKKRYLLFPPGGSKVQFIVGTGIPVPVENQSLTVGWVVKSAYLLAFNSSQLFEPYVTFEKRSPGRRASRYDFYRSLEHTAESFGGGGKECMLRAICESSKVPLRASSLAGQILHIFLTPSTTDEPPISRSDMDYHSAEKLGREQSSNCAALYPNCELSIVDILTVIM
ncbi:UNVERIFIED_CONTAM: hypothetical protein PYX00_008016 [Menopon gallinae]|uniref:Uncharacterized protein n=1 Tax=Menopon gallinae TaxID=328185 RepID=A0AAW2HLL5_9NEOP